MSSFTVTRYDKYRNQREALKMAVEATSSHTHPHRDCRNSTNRRFAICPLKAAKFIELQQSTLVSLS